MFFVIALQNENHLGFVFCLLKVFKEAWMYTTVKSDLPAGVTTQKIEMVFRFNCWSEGKGRSWEVWIYIWSLHE
jgi:hypothetical protein